MPRIEARNYGYNRKQAVVFVPLGEDMSDADLLTFVDNEGREGPAQHFGGVVKPLGDGYFDVTVYTD